MQIKIAFHKNSKLNSNKINLATLMKCLSSYMKKEFKCSFSVFYCCCKKLSQTWWLKWHKCIFLHFWSSEVPKQFHWASGWALTCGSSEGRILLVFSGFQSCTAYILWLAPSSIFADSRVISSNIFLMLFIHLPVSLWPIVFLL